MLNSSTILFRFFEVMDIIVGGKFRLKNRLSKGPYGKVFQGINIKTNDEVAIKLERLDCKQPML